MMEWVIFQMKIYHREKWGGLIYVIICLDG